MMNKQRSLLRSILLGLGVLLALVVYAYGFDVIQVNLEETRDPGRQERLARIMRALARPDIIEYEKEEFVVSTPIFTPCPEGGIPESAPVTDPTLPYIIVTPPCADPRTEVTVEGFNFEPNTTGPLNFIPPSGVSLQMGTIVTDAEGHFILTEKLPKRPETVAQEIRAVTRQNVGLPHFNNNAIETWNKIVETIFLALLATTIGVLVAVPASFLAARNIMAPITSPFTSVALSILTLPVGLVAGWWVAKTVGQLGAPVINNLTLNILGLIVAPVIMWVALRWALPPIEEAKPSLGVRSVRSIVLFITALVGILFLYLISRILMVVGTALVEPLGSLRFLADFLSNMGDILGSVVPLVMALVGAGVLGSIAGRIGQWIVEHTPTVANRGVNLLLGAAGGAVLFAMLGGGINWLYEINQPLWTFTIPAILGGIVGAVMGLVLSRNATLPIGFTIYMITRTIFNALRSIESLVMVIIFVVWVGIGPFAGVLALALHTIASNAKLYSEQVEGIMAGPMEALASTGANRLQTIIYAVIPQIIPPYISYTMYRWDINVRMSTIIGFAGGGGIGFLLIQNINLLNYRAASAQMLAIAIVVATMDYLSSWMRERVI